MPSQLTTMWHCPACRMECRVPTDHRTIRCACGFAQFCNPPGLGDRVAAVLARLGITSKRYVAAKKLVGLRGKCRCHERQRQLNDLHSG